MAGRWNTSFRVWCVSRRVCTIHIVVPRFFISFSFSVGKDTLFDKLWIQLWHERLGNVCGFKCWHYHKFFILRTSHCSNSSLWNETHLLFEFPLLTNLTLSNLSICLDQILCKTSKSFLEKLRFFISSI